MDQLTLTPTQQRIFDVLKDGWEHPVDELVKAIDTHAELHQLRNHISDMRPKLDMMRLTVVCQERQNGRSSYRLARWIDTEE